MINIQFEDETGPLDQGSETRQGRGGSDDKDETGSGRPGAGPGGFCLCPSCGMRVTHKAGVPCSLEKCPKCGNRMVRQ